MVCWRGRSRASAKFARNLCHFIMVLWVCGDEGVQSGGWNRVSPLQEDVEEQTESGDHRLGHIEVMHSLEATVHGERL